MTSRRPGARATHIGFSAAKKLLAAPLLMIRSSRLNFCWFSTGDNISLVRLPNRYTQNVNRRSFGDLNLCRSAQTRKILSRNALVGQNQIAIFDAAETISGLGSNFAAVDYKNPSLSRL